jgi:hypothetical protein
MERMPCPWFPSYGLRIHLILTVTVAALMMYVLAGSNYLPRFKALTAYLHTHHQCSIFSRIKWLYIKGDPYQIADRLT